MGGRTFPEAVDELATLAGLTVPVADPVERRRAEQRRSGLALIEEVASWYEQQLDPAARAYLLRRGISLEVTARWRLGWAPADGGALVRHLTALGIDLAEAEALGVLGRKPGHEPYAFLRDRLVIRVSSGNWDRIRAMLSSAAPYRQREVMENRSSKHSKHWPVVIPASYNDDTLPVSGRDGGPASSWTRSQGRGCARPASEGSLDESPSRPDGIRDRRRHRSNIPSRPHPPRASRPNAPAHALM